MPPAIPNARNAGAVVIRVPSSRPLSAPVCDVCGRFTQKTPAASWTQEFLPLWSADDLTALSTRHALAARYNIAPTQEIPCVFQPVGSDRRSLRRFRWGLLPFWAKDLASGAQAINARSETAHEKNSFKQAFAQRRCVIPADGYYEWAKTPSGKQPYYIRRRDQRMLAMAGLWEQNDRLGEQGEPLYSFTVLTIAANDATREIHDRMPVFLSDQQIRSWLDPSIEQPDLLRPLMRSAPNDWWEIFPVSSQVNSPRNDSPDCIVPIQPQRQLSLFE